MPEDNPLEGTDSRRAQVLEALARERYDRAVPRSAPAWDDAPPMMRYAIMEKVNDVVNEVLEHFTPMSPDHGALALRMELLAGEFEALDSQGLVRPVDVAQAIRRTIAEGSEYGEPKGEADGSHDG